MATQDVRPQTIAHTVEQNQRPSISNPLKVTVPVLPPGGSFAAPLQIASGQISPRP